MTKPRCRGLMVALAMVMVGATTVAATRDARACAMESAFDYQRMSPRRAERLLLSAKQEADAGHSAKARTLAVEVAMARGPAAPVRARAWALAGLASWQRGQREVALRSFRRAKQLAEGQVAIDAVLADATRLPALADLKKALAA